MARNSAVNQEGSISFVGNEADPLIARANMSAAFPAFLMNRILKF